jgi:hypothetical protein
MELIDMFSDIVWDKALENIRYVEQRSKNEMRVFHFEDENAVMLVLQADDPLDFTNNEDIQNIATGEKSLSDFNPKMFRAKKAYESNRKDELYDLMQMGAQPCTDVFWNSFEKLANNADVKPNPEAEN